MTGTARGAAGACQHYLGKYRGTVINNVDPMRENRIQAIVPDLGPDAAGVLALDLELRLRDGEVVTNHDESRFA